MGSFHEYDPDQHEMIWGLVPISGYSTDEGFSVEITEDDYTYEVGLDGDITRSKNKGQSALVTVTLAASSKSNAVFSAARALGLKSSGGADVTPIMIKDRNGTSIFASDKSWIERPPGPSKQKGPGTRVWRIRVVDFTLFEGGT